MSNQYLNPRMVKDRTDKDITKIEDALSSNDVHLMYDVHVYIDAKYQACITDWGKSMFGYNVNFGFDIDSQDIESLKHNLYVMKAKLESFSYGMNSNQNAPKSTRSYPLQNKSNVNVNVNNKNTNTIELNLSFNQARQQVEEMTALSQEQSDEIIEKINEIESISKEKSPKKKKWEKIKPILFFALDKGVDIAIMLWSLALQSGLVQ